MDELRLALRRLAHRPGATLASILTLGCAIGAAAATWSLLSAVLLRPLPVRDPHRLMVVGELLGSIGLYDGHVYPVYPHIRDSGIFAAVAAGGTGVGPLLVSTGGLSVRTPVYFASHDFFDVLGVRLPLGRSFAADEDRRGAAPVAVLSHRYWRRTFNSDPAVLGRRITVAGTPATIVGVAPPGFRGLNLAYAPDIYLPLHTVADVSNAITNFFDDGSRPASPTSWITIVGRLHSDSDPSGTLTRLASVPLPGSRSTQFRLTNINTAVVPVRARAGMTQFSSLLAVTVGLLLLTGCSTVGMLLLIRTEARREEFAMCLALGASRVRLARGVAIEGAVLSLAGAALALPVATWLFAGVRTFQLPGGVEIDFLELSIDVRVVLAAIAGAMAATLLIAFIAGTFGFSANVADALRSRSGATARLARRRTRTVLVTCQVAVALMLLAGAGLFGRSLIAAFNLNPGFETTRIVSGGVSLEPYGYTPERAGLFFDDLLRRLRGNRVVQSAAVSGGEGAMTPTGSITIDGQPRKFPSMVTFAAVDEQYFATIGLRVIAGRDFSGDDRAGAPLVAIVSESLGRMIANGGNPLGTRITMPYSRPPAPTPVPEIVGVASDIITNVTVSEPLVLYMPIAQTGARRSVSIVIRAARDADAARREAMAAIKGIDPAVTPSPMLTMEERIGQQMSAQRFGGIVLGALGVIAALLTVLGTYVLAESMAVLRTREMGIRAALGASGRQLATIVLAETGRLVGIGLVVGLALAWMGASTIRAFLFKVQPLDPFTLVAVSAVILTLALAVSLRPALRAARVDLGRVLREH